MLTIYYNDKKIIFDVSKDKYSNCKSIIEMERGDSFESRYMLFDLLERDNTLVVVCSDLERAFESFKSLFKFIEAAGGITLNQHQEALMIFRNNHWDLPKGKREEGESIEECACREVQEECGIDNILPVRYITSTFHIYLMDGHWILKQTFWFELKWLGATSTLKPQTEEGITVAEWCSLEELKSRVQKSYYTIKEVYQGYVSMVGNSGQKLK